MAAAVSARLVCLLLALSSGATALTVGRLRPTCGPAGLLWSAGSGRDAAGACHGKDTQVPHRGHGGRRDTGRREDEVYGALYPAEPERAVLAVGRMTPVTKA